MANAWGVSVDPSGQYAYVTQSGAANNVSVFSITQGYGRPEHLTWDCDHRKRTRGHCGNRDDPMIAGLGEKAKPV